MIDARDSTGKASPFRPAVYFPDEAGVRIALQWHESPTREHAIKPFLIHWDQLPVDGFVDCDVEAVL
ncbi:hypothetical protein [Arthrobacter sp. Bz4]|uniref:hypothetical protein n=1 Tax=Arthrobacter sp. Bz4 TaxID=2171979 RepID=UPI0010574DA8|nr:hypothetical protein [Arthrobacter sp. Bz4]